MSQDRRPEDIKEIVKSFKKMMFDPSPADCEFSVGDLDVLIGEFLAMEYRLQSIEAVLAESHMALRRYL